LEGKLKKLFILIISCLIVSCSNPTPEPTSTALPTNTPMPTYTPDYIATDQSAENEYIMEFIDRAEKVKNAFERWSYFLQELVKNPSNFLLSDVGKRVLHEEIDALEKDIDSFCNIEPVPGRFIEINRNLKLANSEFKTAFYYLRQSFDEYPDEYPRVLSEVYYDKGRQLLQSATEELEIFMAP